jgi:predicted ester cyclase
MEGRMSSAIEENKALVRRFFTVIESGDLRMFDEIVAEDYDDHLAGQSPGGRPSSDTSRGLRSAFPDLQLPISAIVAEGDRVAVLNAIRGTHKGEFVGLKATGRRIDAMAFQLYRIQNGQLAEHWEVADFATLMQQLQG